jgi:hypothetical protein
LRDRLLTEVGGLDSQDSAASWARRSLPLKDTLTDTDAKLLESAFERKLSEWVLDETTAPVSNDLSSNSNTGSESISREAGQQNAADRHQAGTIDKSVLAVSVPRRYRNKDHLHFVTQQPCLLVAASLRMPITSGLFSHGRLAAKPAMNSQSRSVAHIIARCIASATSEPGGSKLASTRSRSRAIFGSVPE